MNSILAENVAVVVVAIVLSRVFPLTTPVAIAICVLSVTSGPPKAGAQEDCAALGPFSPGQVARLMFQAILIPPGVGMLAVRLIAAVQHFTGYPGTVGTGLLVAGAFPLPVVAWKAFAALSGNGTPFALVTSGRYPAVALAIVKSNFPVDAAMISGAVVIYLILRAMLSHPCLRGRQPGHA